MMKAVLAILFAITFVNTIVAAPPANDDLANATNLPGTTGTINGTTAEATRQTSEPTHSATNGEIVYRTVWYAWTAQQTRPVSLEITAAGFDASMSVYKGSAFPLTTVSLNNDTNGTRPRIDFTATTGVTYHIMVGLYNNPGEPGGDFTLGWAQSNTPSNDAFAAARVLSGTSGSVAATNQLATSEAGEPVYGSGHTIWFNYTNPTANDLSVTFSTVRSFDFVQDTRLAVYTGQTPASLTSVVRNDNVGGTLKSRVTFLAKAGVTYRIALDTANFFVDFILDWGITRPKSYTDFGLVSGPDGEVEYDDAADITVFRPSNGVWYSINSSNSALSQFKFGISSDRPVPSDYDGDGRTDYAVTRNSGGLKTWYIRNSFDGTFRTVQWGLSEDKEVPGDYDNDGRVDLAVFRPSNSVWYIWRSSDQQFLIKQFGIAGDIPVLGDFEDTPTGADIAVFRPSTGQWFIFDGVNTIFAPFGLTGDRPVPSDYDNDGFTDLAVFRPSTGTWFFLRSRTNVVGQVKWGLATDIPMTGDYDTLANDLADFAVFRPSDNTWYIQRSQGSITDYIAFGSAGDIPVSSLARLMQ